jgi:hypothetical protein
LKWDIATAIYFLKYPKLESFTSNLYCYSAQQSHFQRKYQMTRVDEINAQIAKLEAERSSAIQAERAQVLAKMKVDIKLYGFKTSDFKGVLATRAKRGTKTANKIPAK